MIKDSISKKTTRYKWRAFNEARVFVHSLGLKSIEEWKLWSRSDARPIDIPKVPIAVYKHKGWMSWGDWLGTDRIASYKKIYRTFEEARLFARSLGLRNESEWIDWAKSDVRPADIPAYPNGVYKNKAWTSWGDWLGTRNKKGGFRAFEEARKYVQNLGLKGYDEWRHWYKSDARPTDIPANPSRVYEDKGWISWGDWLGTDRVAYQNIVYRPFHEARSFVRTLGLKTQGTWKDWAKSNARPGDIPVAPWYVYKDDGWVGLGDWLGTNRIANQNIVYRPFKEAREFARGLGLKNGSEWDIWAKSDLSPNDIPRVPERVYQNEGWISWGDWLGTNRIANQKMSYRPFKEARDFVHKLGLKNQNDWRIWAKSNSRPVDIPGNPARVYNDEGWMGFGDWLGTGRIASQNMRFRPFKEAREFAQNLGLKSGKAWSTWAKSNMRPVDIPANPEGVYKDKGWAGWGDWLGTGTIAVFQRTYRPFEEAKIFVRSLGITSYAEWRTWCKTGTKPEDIPASPSRFYKGQGWKNWGDWLGTGNQKGGYRSFEEARLFVRSLGIKNREQWTAWANSNDRPDNIPSSPYAVYRDRGWIGWGDWLGIINQWNRNAVLSFLYSIKSILSNLQPAELYAIMRQNGMLVATKESTNSNAPLIKNIRDLCSSANSEADFEKLISEIEKQNQAFDEGISEVKALEIIPSAEEIKEELPGLRSLVVCWLNSARNSLSGLGERGRVGHLPKMGDEPCVVESPRNFS